MFWLVFPRITKIRLKINTTKDNFTPSAAGLITNCYSFPPKTPILPLGKPKNRLKAGATALLERTPPHRSTIARACSTSTATRREQPGSCMVTPIN